MRFLGVEKALEGLESALALLKRARRELKSDWKGQKRKKTKADSNRETMCPGFRSGCALICAPGRFSVTSARVKVRDYLSESLAAITHIKL